MDVGVTFHYFFTRKVMFVRYAGGFVVFPAGSGRSTRPFEAATLRQTQKIRYFPIVLFDAEYWGGRMAAWLENADPARREHRRGPTSASLVVTDSFADVRPSSTPSSTGGRAGRRVKRPGRRGSVAVTATEDGGGCRRR